MQKTGDPARDYTDFTVPFLEKGLTLGASVARSEHVQPDGRVQNYATPGEYVYAEACKKGMIEGVYERVLVRVRVRV